jgi:hypothetical protein
MDPRARALVWAVVVAAALGFGAGWLARVFWEPSPESRARDAYDDLRDRVRRYTR